MADQGFFDYDPAGLTGRPDAKYSASDYSKYHEFFIQNGFFDIEDKDALIVSTIDGRILSVKAGVIFIKGYWRKFLTAQVFAPDVADSELSRYDAIVISLDLNSSDISMRLEKGILASEPTKYQPIRSSSVHEMILAYINIPANQIIIEVDDIQDTRKDSFLCGIAGAISSDSSRIDEKLDTTIFDEFLDEVATGNLDGNAIKIQGTPVSETAPLEGQILAFTGTEIEFVALSAVLQNAVVVGQTSITTTANAKSFIQTVGAIYANRKFIAMAMWQSYSSVNHPFQSSLLGAGTVTAQGKITLTNLYGVTPGTFNLVYAIF